MTHSLRIARRRGALSDIDAARAIEICIRYNLFAATGTDKDLSIMDAIHGVRMCITDGMFHGHNYQAQKETVDLLMRLIQSEGIANVGLFCEGPAMEYYYTGEESKADGFVTVPAAMTRTEVEKVVGEETTTLLPVLYGK